MVVRWKNNKRNAKSLMQSENQPIHLRRPPAIKRKMITTTELKPGKQAYPDKKTSKTSTETILLIEPISYLKGASRSKSGPIKTG